MRGMVGSARIGIVLGIMLGGVPVAWGQSEPEPKKSIEAQPSVTIAGRVQGEASLQKEEKLVVLLLAGWSDALSSDIAGGAGPTVALESGLVEPLVPSNLQTRQTPRLAGSFEFRDIPPGEYQPVVVRIREGAKSGVAIGDGARMTVGNDNIANVELTLKSLSADPPGTRHGGAVEREAAVLEPPSARPRIEIVPVTRPPRLPPVGVGRPMPARSSRNGGKRDLLINIVVGLGIAASVFAFMRLAK